jgi:hypothetical protein
LRSNQVWLNPQSQCRFAAFRAGIVRHALLPGLVAVCFLASQSAFSQEASVPLTDAAPASPLTESGSTQVAGLDPATPVDAVPAPKLSAPLQPLIQDQAAPEEKQPSFFKRPIRQEFIIEGLVSYGNYKIFASGYDEKLYTGGVEYDRHSWGYFLKAQMDYVAEFLPFVLLDKPKNVDTFGNPKTCLSCKPPITRADSAAVRQLVPGIGISPIGFRLLWRPNRKIEPYLEAKGGVLVFAKKVPSNEAAYENFSLQSACGVQVRMNQRWGLRLGLFSDFHFSDAFVVPVNPGLDVMNANLGLSYHFGSQN